MGGGRAGGAAAEEVAVNSVTFSHQLPRWPAKISPASPGFLRLHQTNSFHLNIRRSFPFFIK